MAGPLPSSWGRVTVLAPHPDDETLGCGGTIARLTAAGCEVHVIAVCVGELAQSSGHSHVEERLEELRLACEVLGVADSEVLWTDAAHHMRLDTVPQLELVRALESEARLSLGRTRPEALFIPFHGATNQDHISVHRAGMTLARPHDHRRGPPPRAVLGYRIPDEVWSVVPEGATVAVDISEQRRVKRGALECYASQLRSPPHPRSLAAMELRDQAAGLLHGVAAAEAFIAYRWLL